MIPKIIHQTWKDNTIPDKWKISPLMWKKYHPDWEYILWTDKMIRDYIKLFYPNVLNKFDSYKYNIQRVDIIRYFILKDFGGIYSDLDLYPVSNIESYFKSNEDVYFVFLGNAYGCVTNSFMASKKNAPIWTDVINNINTKLPWYSFIKHFHIMYSTGPIFLTKIIKKYQHTISLLPSKLFMAYNSNEDINIIKEEAILLPLEGKSWNSVDSHILNLLNKYKMQLLYCIITIFIIKVIYFIKN